MDHRCRSRAWTSTVILATVALGTILPGSASAAPASCTAPAAATTSAARATVLRQALADFGAAHPGLNSEQERFLTQGGGLVNAFAKAPLGDDRAQAALMRRATLFVERARELFSRNELGELFSGMGAVQVWMADVGALSEPFCNCTGTGECKFNGGPTGNCEAGCVSWDGEDGRRRDGICSSGGDEM